MNTHEIDFLVDDFYKAISFNNDIVPDFTNLKILFYGDGILINNSFAQPIRFTAQSFIQALEAQVASGDMDQFLQREVHSKTEVFGKAAHRLSVYEYTFADHTTERMPRGVNFIQFLQIEGKWRIISMVWNDENANHILPAEWERDE